MDLTVGFYTSIWLIEGIPIKMISEFKKIKQQGITIAAITRAIEWQLLNQQSTPSNFPLFELSECQLKIRPTRFYQDSMHKTSKEMIVEPIFHHAVFASGFPTDVTAHEVGLYFAQFGVVKNIEKCVHESVFMDDDGHDDDFEVFLLVSTCINKQTNGFMMGYEDAHSIIKVLSTDHSFEQQKLNVFLKR